MKTNFPALVPARSLVRHCFKHHAFKARDASRGTALVFFLFCFFLQMNWVKLQPNVGPGLGGPGWSARIPRLRESDLPPQPHTVSYTDVLGGDTADNQSFVWVLKGRTWTTARPGAFFAAMASGHQYSNLTSLLWLECCYFFHPLLPQDNKAGVGGGKSMISGSKLDS